MLGESQQQNAVRELCEIINQHLAVIGELFSDAVFIVVPSFIIRRLCRNFACLYIFDSDNLIGDGNNGNTSTINAVQANQHVLVCATQEIGSLMRSLGTSALPLIQEQQTSMLIDVLNKMFLFCFQN